MTDDDYLYELGQMIGIQLDQDWRHDFEDPWEAAEAWIRRTPDEYLAPTRVDIALVFSDYPNQAKRYDLFQLNFAFRDADEFDAWLLAVYNRIEQALAGIHTDPLVDPNPQI